MILDYRFLGLCLIALNGFYCYIEGAIEGYLSIKAVKAADEYTDRTFSDIMLHLCVSRFVRLDNVSVSIRGKTYLKFKTTHIHISYTGDSK